MKNYIIEIEKVHPFIEEHHQANDVNGYQIDIVMHESEDLFYDYDYFINGEHQDGGRMLTKESQNVIDKILSIYRKIDNE